jgi:hypothetical protein
MKDLFSKNLNVKHFINFLIYVVSYCVHLSSFVLSLSKLLVLLLWELLEPWLTHCHSWLTHWHPWLYHELLLARLIFALIVEVKGFNLLPNIHQASSNTWYSQGCQWVNQE